MDNSKIESENFKSEQANILGVKKNGRFGPRGSYKKRNKNVNEKNLSN